MRIFTAILALMLSGSQLHAVRFANKVGLVAGSGLVGNADGDAASASFSSPTALALDPGQALYVLDKGGSTVRRVSLDSRSRVGTVLQLVEPAVDLAWGGGKLWVAYAKHIDAYADLAQAPLRSPVSGKLAQVAVTLSGTAAAYIDADGKAYLAEAGAPAALKFRALTLSNSAKALAFLGQGPLFLERFDAPYTTVAFERFDAEGNSGEVFTMSLGLTGQAAFKYDPPRIAAARYDDGMEKVYLACLGSNLLLAGKPKAALHQLELPGRGGINVDYGLENAQWPWRSLAGLAVDPLRRTLFLSDLTDPKLEWVKDYEYQEKEFGMRSIDFAADFEIPRRKHQGVTRILYYGTSYSYYSIEAGLGKNMSLNKRLEYFLNAGAGRDEGAYEVIFDGDALVQGGYGLDNLTMARDGIAKRADFDVDAIYCSFSHIDLVYGTIGFLFRPMTREGVPAAGVDPEMILDKSPASRYTGISLELYKEIKEHQAEYAPDITLNEEGQLKFDPTESDVYRLLSKPRFASIATRATLQLAEAVAKAARETRPGKPLIFAFYPSRNFLGRYENSGEARFHKQQALATFDSKPLREGMEKLGFTVLDLDSDCRDRAMNAFPMFLNDDHLSSSGVDLLAVMSSQRLRPVLLGNAPAAAPKAPTAPKQRRKTQKAMPHK